jgi:hypothetical protein
MESQNDINLEKQINMEKYCIQLLNINKSSSIFNQIDYKTFIYSINDTELKNNIDEITLNKLHKIISENNYITGSILRQLLLKNINNQNGDEITIINKENGFIQSILDNKLEDRIIYDGNNIFFTASWYQEYKNNKFSNYIIDFNKPLNQNNKSLNQKIKPLYQNIFLYYYLNKKTLDELSELQCDKNDIELIDDEYILRSMFKNIDLSDDIHIKYIIYYIILKPEILNTKFKDSKNIIILLLEEYTIIEENINKINKLFTYINTFNSEIFDETDNKNNKVISYTKNDYELYLVMNFL